MASRRRIVWWTCLVALAVALTAPARGEASFSTPARGEILAPGAVVETRWTSPCSASRSEVTEAELLLSLDGGKVFAIRISSELSGCQSHFRWTVPALPSRNARLALREGVGGQEDSETIRIVSDEFTILPDREGRREDLYHRMGEWWTQPTLALEAAEDRLAQTIGEEGEVRTANRNVPDVDGSGASGAIARPGRCLTPLAPETPAARRAARPRLVRPPSLLALRL